METRDQEQRSGGYRVGRHSNALKKDLRRNKTGNQRFQLQELSCWMPWHTAFAFLNPLLIGVLQVKCQGALVSPFETHTRAIWTFLVATLIYCFSFAADIKCHRRRLRKTNCFKISGHVALVSGSLSSISLVSVLLPPFLGSLIFFFWIIVPLVVLHQLIIKQSYGRHFQWTAIEAVLLSFVLNIWNRFKKRSNYIMKQQPESAV